MALAPLLVCVGEPEAAFWLPLLSRQREPRVKGFGQFTGGARILSGSLERGLEGP
jgi:hypothetical protein